MTNPLVQFGWHKGEMDFSINCEVQDLTIQDMNDLRSIIVVGIGTMEDMWRREQERKHPAQMAELEKK